MIKTTLQLHTLLILTEHRDWLGFVEFHSQIDAATGVKNNSKTLYSMLTAMVTQGWIQTQFTSELPQRKQIQITTMGVDKLRELRTWMEPIYPPKDPPKSHKKKKVPKPLDEEQRANLQLMIEDIVSPLGIVKDPENDPGGAQTITESIDKIIETVIHAVKWIEEPE